MDFIYTSYAFIWLAVPVLGAILILIYRRAKKATGNWFEPTQYRWSFPLLKAALRLGGVACLMFALMGPYRSEEIREVESLAHEVYILLDVSASMHTEDIRPSRLQKAKRELKALVDELHGDKIGLIVFADYPFIQCPLTQDRQAVNLFLDLADPAQFAQQGTQLRPALQMALERFLSVETPPGAAGRVVVLLSDGEDHGGTFSSVIERLRRQGVKVFPVGVGTYAGGQVPAYVDGKPQGFKETEEGLPAVSRLTDDQLRELADEFDATYYRLDGPSQNLRALAQEIRMLRPAALEVSREQLANNQYQLFLLIGICCLMGSLFLMPTKKGLQASLSQKS